MSKLQKALDALAAQDADAENPCFALNPQVPTLAVEATDGRRWILPWQHFLNAHHDAHRTGETLWLCFATHEVVVTGHNLGALADEIAHLRLGSLRPAPRRYAAATDPEPFVAEIHVRPPSPESPAETSQKMPVSS